MNREMVRPASLTLAGILTIASGKHKKIGTNDPIMQQVKMMTEYESSHQNSEQDNPAPDFVHFEHSRPLNPPEYGGSL